MWAYLVAHPLLGLAHQLAGAESQFFDLESSLDRQVLSAVPERTLAPLRGLVVLDEVQTMPQLLPVLRVLSDRRETPARFLLLGSASPDLIRGAAESLAGRVAFVQLGGFDVTETGLESATRLWERGGFPRSFLAEDATTSYAWRQDFIETFLSRDAARFGITLPPEGLRIGSCGIARPEDREPLSGHPCRRVPGAPPPSVV